MDDLALDEEPGGTQSPPLCGYPRVSALPIWCQELELGGPLPGVIVSPPRQDGRYSTVRMLLRLHGEPLGYVQGSLRDGQLPTAELLHSASVALRERAAEHLKAEGLTDVMSLEALPPSARTCPNRVDALEQVTVAVCTRNRPQVMRRCLQRLRDLQYPRLEILVVDNAPTDDSTQTLVREAALDDARVRYVREERPGLACARNRAVLEARGQLLAFTDDDVSVDSLWVHGLVRGLRRRPDVACITGLVASASIESVAEAYFDARVSWSAVQAPRTYDLRTGQSQDALFPYSPGIFGTGANLALRTDVIRELGGFDEALGAGTVTRGGEDLDIFIRVLREGYALVYEPSALVWHHHRADMEALSEQMYAYGTGFTALVAKLMANRSTRWELLRRVPTGLGRFRRAGQATSRSAPPGVRLPRALLLQELKGMAHGPLLYVQARRRIPPRANKAQP